MGVREWTPPGPVSALYFASNAPVSIIIGPIGSAKTTTSFMKLLRHMSEQEPGPDGIRRSIWIVCRTTYPELDATTFAQFEKMFPEGAPVNGGFGSIKRSPPKRYDFKFNDVEAEIHFIAFDGPDSLDQIKSMNITGFFINELQFFSREVFDVLRERSGRYPDPFTMGVSPTFYGGFADANAPMSLHWTSIMMGQVPIPSFIRESERAAYVVPKDPDTGKPLIQFFLQPPGLLEVRQKDGSTQYVTNPKAENLANLERLRKNYYLVEAQGKTKAYVDSQILCRPAAHKGGRPVHPDYDDARHYMDAELLADRRYPLWVGLDFGLHFAAIFGQIVEGQWRMLSEIYLEGVTNSECAKRVREHLFLRYPAHAVTPGDKVEHDARLRIYGDPSGDYANRTGSNDFAIFASHGLRVLRAPGGNRWEPKEGADQYGSFRKTAMDHVLTTSAHGGKPGFLVTRPCPILRDGLRSGYVWAETQSKGVEEMRERPIKNMYSHVVEAAQYLLVGGGAGRAAIGQTEDLRPTSTLRRVDVFDRGPFDVFRR